MIGAHRHGFNVFFLREDQGINFFPEVGIQEIHDNFCTRCAQHRWHLVKDMPWKEALTRTTRIMIMPAFGLADWMRNKERDWRSVYAQMHDATSRTLIQL
jgi:hypothetical protein